jgi:transcriptional regulator with XRE-family HTH domain
MDVNTRLAEIAGLIKAKRREDKVGLRAAAEASKVSASTLSRLERGAASSLPDAETITRLSKWLNVSVSTFLSEAAATADKMPPELKTPERVEVYLRADKNLSLKTADALGKMFRLLYAQMTEEQGGKRRPKGG